MSIIFYQNFIPSALAERIPLISDVKSGFQVTTCYHERTQSLVLCARGLDTSGPVTSLWGSQTVESPLRTVLITQCDPTVRP